MWLTATPPELSALLPRVERHTAGQDGQVSAQFKVLPDAADWPTMSTSAISASAGQSAISAADYQVAAAKKSQNVAKEQAQALVELVQQVPMPQPGVGSLIDVLA